MLFINKQNESILVFTYKNCNVRYFLLFLIFCFFAVSIGFAQSKSNPMPIEGEWLVHNKKSIVKVYEENGQYFGKLAWIDPEHNPDEEERRQALGTLILENLTPQGNTQYKNGRVYAMPQDRHYDCNVEVKKDELIISISIGWFTKTLVWKRVNERYSQL